MKYANLHLHSTYSDGSYTPGQLVLIAKSLGYGALAVTDHETNGGVRELYTAAHAAGMDAMSGVEFYGTDWGQEFHITALDFDNDDPAFNAFVQERIDGYNEYSRQCVERALRLGLIHDVTWNDFVDSCEEKSWICVDQIFAYLRKKNIIPRAGNVKELRKEMFRSPEAKAFKPAMPPVDKVISVIRKAGGIAAVAHPYQQLQYVPKLVEMGMNGIEVSHPDLYEDTRPALAAADEYHLYRCGGTDHTGALSGCGGQYAICALQGITEEEYQFLRERRLG